MNYWQILAVALVFSFTFISACLTAQFGYTVGIRESATTAWLYAFLGSVISVSVALFAFTTGLFSFKRRYVAMAFSLAIGAVFVFFDIAGNFGIAAYTREGSSLVARNSNSAVAKREARIERLKSLIAEAQSKPVYKAELRSAGAYRNHMVQLQNTLNKSGRNIFQRSKGCTDVTLPESQALCFEWSSAKQGLESSEEQTRLRADVVAWERQIGELEMAIIANPQTTSGAIAQSLLFARLWNQTLKPGEEAATWADMGVAGAMGFISTFGAIFCALAAGWLGVRPRYETVERNPYHRAGYVPDYRDDDVREFERVSARTVDPHAPPPPPVNQGDVSVVVAGGPDIHVPDKLREAMDRVNASLAQYELKIPLQN